VTTLSLPMWAELLLPIKLDSSNNRVRFRINVTDYDVTIPAGTYRNRKFTGTGCLRKELETRARLNGSLLAIDLRIDARWTVGGPKTVYSALSPFFIVANAGDTTLDHRLLGLPERTTYSVSIFNTSTGRFELVSPWCSSGSWRVDDFSGWRESFVSPKPVGGWHRDVRLSEWRLNTLKEVGSPGDFAGSVPIINSTVREVELAATQLDGPHVRIESAGLPNETLRTFEESGRAGDDSNCWESVWEQLALWSGPSNDDLIRLDVGFTNLSNFRVQEFHVACTNGASMEDPAESYENEPDSPGERYAFRCPFRVINNPTTRTVA